MPVLPLTGDCRGDPVLALALPTSRSREEVLIAASDVTAVDTYTGVALRTSIEYHARWCQQPVTFCPPRDGAAWDLLSNLVGHELPGHVVVADDAPPAAPHVRDAVLPAQRIEEAGLMNRTASRMARSIGGERYGDRAAVMIATAFSVLADNALHHGSSSPIGAVYAVGYDREAHALQLVVTDLGPGLTGAAEPRDAMNRIVKHSRGAPRRRGSFHGLAGLAADADRKEIDLELRIASGAARLSWRRGDADIWESGSVPGFTAAAIVRLDQ